MAQDSLMSALADYMNAVAQVPGLAANLSDVDEEFTELYFDILNSLPDVDRHSERVIKALTKRLSGRLDSDQTQFMVDDFVQAFLWDLNQEIWRKETSLDDKRRFSTAGSSLQTDLLTV